MGLLDVFFMIDVPASMPNRIFKSLYLILLFIYLLQLKSGSLDWLWLEGMAQNK